MEQPLHTRRQFLRTGVVGGAVGCTVPGFLHVTMQNLSAAAEGAVQAASGKDSPILVVVQLAGGNDGINTVVPYTNDFYYSARKNLALDQKECLSINDELGFHPALGGLKELYDNGSLAVVQGVGYPNPNRSHFRSMEIWQTASDANKVESYGWLGRYFDNQCEGEDPGVAISLGKQQPQAFRSQHAKGITFADPNRYQVTGLTPNADAEKAFLEQMNAEEQDEEARDGGSIDMLAAGKPDVRPVDTLDFLERTAMDAQVSSQHIRRIAKTPYHGHPYPGTKLARDLNMVAKLIAGGMSTRIYYVSQGGFDTHANQKGSHQRLLTQTGDALNAFLQDMKRQGNFDRVTVLMFSEFGRRVAENGSGGTDHGAAAPSFVAGGGVKGGLYGTYPSLDPKHLYKGDLKHTVDFRSLYGSVIDQVLQAPSQAILGRKFPKLGLFG